MLTASPPLHTHQGPSLNHYRHTQMATHARAQRVMDASDDRRGPQVYLHVEFGVSWSRKPPKNHEVTYRSRGLRERTPNFPRQVPPPNTNYLAAIHTFEERQTRTRQSRHIPQPNPNLINHQMQEYYQAPRRQQHQPTAAVEQSRQPRSESRSSHERGHSAPPPLGENPWDENYPGGQDSTMSYQGQPDQWKALPAEPSQFRLGEGGQPWSAWSWPIEYHPEHDEEPESARERQRDNEPYATSATMVSVFSPEPTATPRRRRDEETGRARELGALSAAMMTVDNGFEQQWWNRGPRQSVGLVDDSAPSLQHPFSSSLPDLSISDLNPFGDDVYDRSDDRPSIAAATMVSPLSESDASPLPTFQSLHRSLSTRSEELFFHGR